MAKARAKPPAASLSPPQPARMPFATNPAVKPSNDSQLGIRRKRISKPPAATTRAASSTWTGRGTEVMENPQYTPRGGTFPDPGNFPAARGVYCYARGYILVV